MHARLLALAIAAQLDLDTELPAEKARSDFQERVLVAARDRFLVEIAPTLRKVGWTLGTIGTVSRSSAVLMPLIDVRDMSTISYFVPSKRRPGVGAFVCAGMTSFDAMGVDDGKSYTSHVSEFVAKLHACFRIFTKAWAAPGNRQKRAEMARQNQTCFCMGRVVFTPSDVRIGWQVLAPQEVYQPSDAPITGIDFAAPRPPVVVAAARPAKRRREDAPDNADRKHPTKKKRKD